MFSAFTRSHQTDLLDQQALDQAIADRKARIKALPSLPPNPAELQRVQESLQRLQHVRGTWTTSSPRPDDNAPTVLRLRGGAGELDGDIIDDWKNFSRTSRWRSPALKEVDRAVDRWNNRSRRNPGKFGQNEEDLQNILKAIDHWRTTKDGPSDRGGKVDQLRERIRKELADLQRRKQEAYEELPPSLARHLVRKRREYKTTHDLYTALSERDLPAFRKLHEALTARYRDETLSKAVRDSGVQVTDPSLDDRKIRSLMTTDQRYVFPELDVYLLRKNPNVLHDSNSPLESWRNSPKIMFDSGSFSINYDPDMPESLRNEAQKAMERAVAMIEAKGIVLPSFKFLIPKYTRTLHVSVKRNGETGNEELDITIVKTAMPDYAATFLPDVIILGSAGFAKPNLTSAAMSAPGILDGVADYYEEFMVAFLIHELGHVAYHQRNPGSTALWDTSLREQSTAQALFLQVSSYAYRRSAGDRGVIEEFAMEYFTGWIMDRRFVDSYAAMRHQMYLDLGAPISEGSKREIPPLPLDDNKLAELTRLVSQKLGRQVYPSTVASVHSRLTIHQRRVVLWRRVGVIIKLLQEQEKAGGRHDVAVFSAFTRSHQTDLIDQQALDQAIAKRKAQIKEPTEESSLPPDPAERRRLQESIQRLQGVRDTWTPSAPRLDGLESQSEQLKDAVSAGSPGAGQPSALRGDESTYAPSGERSPVPPRSMSGPESHEGNGASNHIESLKETINWQTPRRSSFAKNGAQIPQEKQFCVSVAVITRTGSLAGDVGR